LNTAQVLDIRKAQEYKNKNVGGLHLELENIDIKELNFNSETEIIVCCNNGNKSLDFAQKLNSAGFTNKIYSLKGGLNAYFSVY
jgi:rhodanese-related sulfurtransferase